jgi:hypothetical protein
MREKNWEQKRSGEKLIYRPNSFCLGMSCLPFLEIFASSRYLHERYKELVEKALQSLKRKYPHFVDGEEFTGALTTNAMEGGNWRIKYELRVPYKNLDSIYSRALLALITDSLYNFLEGVYPKIRCKLDLELGEISSYYMLYSTGGFRNI